ncbi:hypothetical protein AAC387_Pa07g2384 [Persea americana]
MTSKQCKEHKKKKLQLRFFQAVLAFIILILIIILVVWLVLRPTKPRFELQDAIINQLKTTSPNTLTTNAQVTLYSRNPNERIGVYYDRLLVYLSYRNQQITLPCDIPPFYQGHKDVNIWSPFLYGVSVPISPSVALSLGEDQNLGGLMVNVKIEGRVRWKVGTWVSGRYHLYVNCPAYMVKGSNGIRLQNPSGCSVDV